MPVACKMGVVLVQQIIAIFDLGLLMIGHPPLCRSYPTAYIGIDCVAFVHLSKRGCTVTDDEAKAGKLTFSVDSSLLFQLGEQLVAKPSIALAELVKNAYDADATEVTIEFEKVDRPGGTITVADNGYGMTFEDIQRGWMRIATAAKRNNTVSKVYCRSVTGAKGIGRFAARRLGNKLELQSTAETKTSSLSSEL